MFLLDMDTITLLVYGKNSKLLSTAASKAPIALSIVTRIEILQGRFSNILKAASNDELLQAQERLDRWEAAVASYPIIAIADAAGHEFSRLAKIRSLRKIGRADLLIASIALASSATLATRNLKDFAFVPGLRTENWAD
jgi:tRNA(fMet)-specific endonuclease VapC